MRPGQALISAIIVGVLAMQSQAYFTDSRFYPFVNYPMFSRGSGPPVQAVFHQMHAQMPDGRRVNVCPDYMRLRQVAWRDLILLRIIAKPIEGPSRDLVEEHRAESLLRVITAVDRHEGDKPVALHITSETHLIVPGGIEQSTVYQTLVLDAGAGDE